MMIFTAAYGLEDNLAKDLQQFCLYYVTNGYLSLRSAASSCDNIGILARLEFTYNLHNCVTKAAK